MSALGLLEWVAVEADRLLRYRGENWKLSRGAMPDQLPTIRIFIASPSDVRPERLKAEQIIARLDREFGYHFRVEAVLYEREPLVAIHHVQDAHNIPAPRTTDIVVVLLWTRLGIPLPPDQFRGAISGRPVT